MHVILAHSNTDFDGLAAQQAAARLFPAAYAVLAPQLSAPVAEFVGLYRDTLGLIEHDALPAEPVEQWTLVDTNHVWGSWDTAPNCTTTIIDHHSHPERDAPGTQRIAAPTGATTTVLVEQMLAAHLPISSAEATLFALGIYEDTGDLTYSETTVRDVRCVAALLERGADLQVIRRYRYRALTSAQEQAYRALLEHLHHSEIAGWSVMTGWAKLEQHTPDLSSLIERLRDLYQPAVLIVALGMGDGTQLIARSSEGVLDVGQLMETWGGGGHPQAAAAWVNNDDPQAVWQQIQAQVAEQITPATTAAEIMTSALRSLPPNASIQAAAEMLRRWDYGAVPIVDEHGRLLGDIGRSELNKAERHGLQDAPIRRYMWRSPATVAPELPLRAVRQQIAAEVRGRVYVVDAQRQLRGVITRSDVLHHTEQLPSITDEHAAYLQKLSAALPAATWAHVRWAADWAAQRGWSVYTVGGFIRDLLLDRQPGDLDLVVEGDGIAVAEALAQHTGGSVRAHAPFGTATVVWEQSTEHLDFITARTEFYEHPTALPQVEAASLRHDLHRRDFTINTLALALSPPHRGQLYDFYGGLRDLRRRRIRVLHNLSFIDDPTRLLRAIRLAARLNFQIEARTGELIHDAIEQDLLNRTTPARIWHEMRRILNEPTVGTALALLEQWGLLSEIHPDLEWNALLADQIACAAQLELAPPARQTVLLLLLLAPLSANERQQLAQRYTLPSEQRQQLEQWDKLLALRAALEQQQLSAGAIDALLEPFDAPLLSAAAIYAPGALASAIERYRTTLRPTPSLITGHTLRAYGLRPGPAYGPILAAARRAQLDGQLSPSSDLNAWIQHYLEQEDL